MLQRVFLWRLFTAVASAQFCLPSRKRIFMKIPAESFSLNKKAKNNQSVDAMFP